MSVVFTVEAYTSRDGSIYRVQAFGDVASETEAKEYAATFPKSLRLYPHKVYGRDNTYGCVSFDVALRETLNNGGKNETGLRRLRSFLNRVEWRYEPRALNAATREAFDKLVAE